MATVPLLSRKVSSVQKVNTAMSNLVYYSSQKKYTHLQVILFSFLFRIWTPLSFLLDKDHTLCSGMELVTRVFYSPYSWILLKISKFYVQQNDKELLIIKLFGALLILPFHDIPVLIRLLKILSSSLQNGRYTVRVQVENPNHGFKLDNDFLNAVSLNFPKTEEKQFYSFWILPSFIWSFKPKRWWWFSSSLCVLVQVHPVTFLSRSFLLE